MTCRQARNRMNPALDGALDEAGQAELQAHLKMCAACKREFDALSLLVQLGKSDSVAPPEGFARSVLQKWEEDPAILPMPKRKSFQVPLSLYAAAAVVFILALTFNNGSLQNFLQPVAQQSPAEVSAVSEENVAPAPRVLQQDAQDYAVQPEVGETDGVMAYHAEEKAFILPDETLLHEDPLVTERVPGKYAFVVAVRASAEAEQNAVKGLQKLATVAPADYYRLTKVQLQSLLKKLGDGVSIYHLEEAQFIDTLEQTGIVMLYQGGTAD